MFPATPAVRPDPTAPNAAAIRHGVTSRPRALAVAALAALCLSAAPAAAAGPFAWVSTALPAPAAEPAPAGDADTVLPTPEVELPELPYDKAQMPRILELDVFLTDAAKLRAAAEVFDGQFQDLKRAVDTSLNGTNEDQIKGVLAMVDGVERFEREGRPLAEKALAVFTGTYESDDTFSSRYREIYSAAEEELYDIIEDNRKRRETSSVMGNTYKYAASTNSDYLQSCLEESVQLRDQVVTKVLRGAETDMMVADYKKGRALVDLLQVTKNKLALVSPLDPGNGDIAAMLARVDEKAASRQAEVDAARAETRMPARHTGSTAASGAAGLEEAVRMNLEEKGYDVKDVRVASPWIAVHSVLGIHLYSQIDFHVAATSHVPEEAKQGVLDVLYVTGKTGGPNQDVPFASTSIGCVAQMLEANLD